MISFGANLNHNIRRRWGVTQSIFQQVEDDPFQARLLGDYPTLSAFGRHFQPQANILQISHRLQKPHYLQAGSGQINALAAVRFGDRPQICGKNVEQVFGHPLQSGCRLGAAFQPLPSLLAELFSTQQ
jgi:hypothetical protein